MTNIKIAAFAPDQNFHDRFMEVWNAHKESFEDDEYNKNFKYEVQMVVRPSPGSDDMENIDAEAILARGGTAAYLRTKYFDIPIIEIPITGADSYNTISVCKKKYAGKKIGVVGTKNVILSMEQYREITGLDIKSYTMKGLLLAEECVKLAKSEGVEVVIGGVTTCELAIKNGLDAVAFHTSPETISYSISLAKQSARNNIIAKQKIMHYNKMLDCINEGIISMDNNNIITIFNKYASDLLNIDKNSAIGKHYSKVITYPRLNYIFQSQNEVIDELISEGKLQLNTNKLRVKLRGEEAGHIVHIQNATKIQELESGIRRKIHSRGLNAKYDFENICGESKIIKDTIKMAKVYAEVNSNVLIEGATGTGKELFAQSIHNYSDRKNAPFVAVNCAAIPESLLESELFGYVEGAFTGTRKGGKTGIFELAHRGTIFLDEIWGISNNLQGRLLRVIQEKEIMRLGDDKIIPIDVRIISATNKSLISLVKSGNFRDDLYFRLDILKLILPSLYEREKDIIVLANLFIEDFCKKLKRGPLFLSNDVKDCFLSYHWPGNIRELRNICERLCVLCKDSIVKSEFLKTFPLFGECKESEPSCLDFKQSVQEYEKKEILSALIKNGNNKGKAADYLKMSRTTLWKKMRELGI